ncbi:MAG: FAD-binding oxidoreductase [Thermomicrobiales bacterium]
MVDGVSELRRTVIGSVFSPGESGFAEEVAGFNAAVQHTPEIVVGAASVDDVARAVRFARERTMPVAIHCSGHGLEQSISSGMMITTRRLDTVSIDPVRKTATIGAGARWKTVVDKAAEHGLAPITGSSPNVGPVGFLMGGGIGPLARSHGVGSDYLTRATIVSGTGETVTASKTDAPDLFWALRGGKHGLGVVTEVQVRLVDLPSLYAGSLMIAENDMESAFRQWIDWTKTADARVTTSALMMRFPAVPFIPEHLHGQRFLFLRFAFPGAEQEGQALATPLRAFAPIVADQICVMPTTQMGLIHNDPEGPLPARFGGWMLDQANQDLASQVLDRVGPGTDSPLLGIEVRHIGGAVKQDVPEGSAVGGRGANYTMYWISVNPAAFDTELPGFVSGLRSAIAPLRHAETNVNFIGKPENGADYERAWSLETFSRLSEIRKTYDPDGLFAPVF